MRKIPTVYLRNDEDRRHVTTTVDPQCDWVLAGEGIPRRKYDGTCVLYSQAEGRWYARREVKPGKNAPPGFYLVQYDPITDKRIGWEVAAQSPFAAFLDEAIGNTFPDHETPFNGTYELIGPKINGNPEQLRVHMLARHATAEQVIQLYDNAGAPAHTPAELVRNVAQRGWEGLVWHHPDGRMAKLKYRDLPESPWGLPGE